MPSSNECKTSPLDINPLGHIPRRDNFPPSDISLAVKANI